MKGNHKMHTQLQSVAGSWWRGGGGADKCLAYLFMTIVLSASLNSASPVCTACFRDMFVMVRDQVPCRLARSIESVMQLYFILVHYLVNPEQGWLTFQSVWNIYT